ncbi:MAG: hypothetical protein INR65_10920 [Gluconacetobacter diazotrophicus]|nr:hypothetical protein [Gluconacetobacter diazotrophicus]
MKTRPAFYCRRAAWAAAMLLTSILVGGCITQKPGQPSQVTNNAQPARTPRKHITHPGGHQDHSKDTPPAPITHPGG